MAQATADQTILGEPCCTAKCLPAKAVANNKTFVAKSLLKIKTKKYMYLSGDSANFELLGARIA